MPRIVLIATLLTSILTFPHHVSARDANSGLHAVAVSPDGTRLAIGGNNRVLYVLDRASMKTLQRVWIGAPIGGLTFNRDGSRLLLEDDEETVHFFDTSSWKEVAKIQKAGFMSVAQSRNVVAVLNADWQRPSISFLSMADGSSLGKVELPEKSKVLTFALDKDAKRLAVVFSGQDVDESVEKKVSYSDIPKDLKGIEKDEFTQKNDGKQSKYALYDVPSGKVAGEFQLWYMPKGKVTPLLSDETLYLFTYDNTCGKINLKDHSAQVFEVEHGYNYGMGIADDRSVFLGGGLRDGTLYSVSNGTQVKFNINRLPGWPEYFGAFTVDSNGIAYGVTSGYRVVRISKAGSVEAVAPVY